MGKYNDLDLSQWREYTDIETDSLWIIDKRDNERFSLTYAPLI